LQRIPKQARILEVGCGGGWMRDFLKGHGWEHYTGIDLRPPADVVGDIRRWRDLGLRPESFDVIIAFEVVEHVDCLNECYDLLRPGGQMMLTTPVPCMDWALKLLEKVGLNQKRTSPHDHLVWISRTARFEHKSVRIVGLMSQWAILGKKQ
jgi:2-polyprenyl-3-methyl-5-hydroxy-6-metoxy-1,4-benzoquinol methylase